MSQAALRDDDTFLALDIGGTNVTGGLVDRAGRILHMADFPTSLAKERQQLIDLIVDHLKSLWNKADDGRRPKALAIGAPGWLKPREGVLVVAPNLPGWRDVPITRIMSQALDLPARLENDANLYALGEWLSGAGRGSNNEITITLGTGVGGGLILDGRLWSGSFASAAEIGHIPLGEGYPAVCGCGRVGCLETVASARGMARLAREGLARGEKSLYQGSPEDLTAKDLEALAREGDSLALGVLAAAGRAIGQILTGVFNLLSLETAVIGGGGAGAFEHLKGPIMEVLAARLVTAQIGEIKVVKGLLGVTAPLVGGAALLAAEGY
jgi:glucokinase